MCCHLQSCKNVFQETNICRAFWSGWVNLDVILESLRTDAFFSVAAIGFLQGSIWLRPVRRNTMGRSEIRSLWRNLPKSFMVRESQEELMGV